MRLALRRGRTAEPAPPPAEPDLPPPPDDTELVEWVRSLASEGGER